VSSLSMWLRWWLPLVPWLLSRLLGLVPLMLPLPAQLMLPWPLSAWMVLLLMASLFPFGSS